MGGNQSTLYVQLHKPIFHAGDNLTGDVHLIVPEGMTCDFDALEVKVCCMTSYVRDTSISPRALEAYQLLLSHRLGARACAWILFFESRREIMYRCGNGMVSIWLSNHFWRKSNGANQCWHWVCEDTVVHKSECLVCFFPFHGLVSQLGFCCCGSPFRLGTCFVFVLRYF